MPAAIASVVEFVRRVVDGLLRGECRGRFLFARLVTVTRGHLDRSYTPREVARAISTCVACASSARPCLGVTGP